MTHLLGCLSCSNYDPFFGVLPTHLFFQCRTAKNFKKEKRIIRRWRLERFDEDAVKLRYQNALKAEVHGFSESVKSKLEGGMKGYDLVLMEWENIVNRVVKSEVGEKMIVCGRAARWWDNEIKEQISLRRELYK